MVIQELAVSMDKQKIHRHANPYSGKGKPEYDGIGRDPASLPRSRVQIVNQLKVPDDSVGCALL
jgi:hypothetical protein